MKTHIVIHHSKTKDGPAVSWGAIRKYHMTPGTISRDGARDIGYHAGIELVGDGYEVLLGRWWDQDGAHCRELNMNSQGLGLCLIGDFDEAPPPSGQWTKAVQLVKRWVVDYDIPIERVLGHGEAQRIAGVATPKSCPGRMFSMDKFRADVRASF